MQTLQVICILWLRVLLSITPPPKNQNKPNKISIAEVCTLYALYSPSSRVCIICVY